MRPVLKGACVVLAIFASLGGILWGAYYLEDYKKRIKTVVVERPDGDLFVIETKERKGPTVLIQCDEDNFEDAFKAFRRFLGVESVPLTVPGGPMLLAQLPAEVSEDLRPAQRAAIEVLKRYSPSKIILLAHSDCLLYDTVAAWQDQLDRVKEKQFEDMQKAVAAIKRWLPHTQVEVYYALKDGDKLRFNPVDLTSRVGSTEIAPIEGR